jgi:hypothetical protein
MERLLFSNGPEAVLERNIYSRIWFNTSEEVSFAPPKVSESA